MLKHTKALNIKTSIDLAYCNRFEETLLTKPLLNKFL